MLRGLYCSYLHVNNLAITDVRWPNNITDAPTIYAYAYSSI